MPRGWARGRSLGAAALLLLAALVRPVPAHAFDIIVNAANPANQVSRDELVRIYFGKRITWELARFDAPVRPVLNKAVDARIFFTLIGTSEERFLNHWYRQIYSGMADAPPRLPSDERVMDFIRRTPGAIGLVERVPGDAAGVKTIPLAP